ncbi:ABC transporter permease [Streptococcus dysgalactiae]|uniref:ABC transporter permease n=1 Tax=Streptococcus dysgalactiae subsp. equisimilis TaxID=119602 RepID=A0A9X8XFT6_STREQ|nr:ABC transporter permease [Streptococcus dysgalactiae]SQF67062.1 ABC transporter permease [Streptococcus dysgalactiae subsp. equisimilis]VEF07071.1 ABC transporter permease [Streptococcus dysgalactiae subsp. equisimilis]
MFGKLLKYEFKSIGKWYFALNAAVIAIAAILSFTIKQFTQQADNAGAFGTVIDKMLSLTLSLTFGALIAGSLLSTLLIIINRFSKNIFGREGYLTLTLPVTSHQIILSKLVASFICSLFNLIILIFGIAILIVPMVDFKDVVETLSKVIKAEYILDNAFILSYLLVSSLASILLLYFAISIGQLFSNRRGLMAFIAYFALMILFSVATTYLNLKVFSFESTSEVLPYKEHVYLYVIIVEEFVEMLICYLGTHFIIKNKLNIQ